jgi:uncharacterized membrane protein YjgN (DUF898 family)
MTAEAAPAQSFAHSGKFFNVLGLAFKNAALTLLTCGLYWPWAAVALARYKLGCLELESNRSMAAVAMAVAVQPVDAAGDGSLDAFGLDIGL